jgi:hydroxypyruvate isomerase
MLKFAANLSMMFNEVPFLDRFSAAADAGFQGVEYLFPFEFPVEAIEERLLRHRLENVLFNLAPGNWSAGERGITCIPGRESEFRQSVETAIAYATRLKTKRVHAMAGIVPAGADPAAVEATYIANLRYAAEKLAAHGITLLIEAINTRDMPGFYLNTQAQSYAVCTAVNAPNIRMQMDLYHMQIMEGDLTYKWPAYRSGMNQAAAKSIMRICSASWRNWATTDGSAASTVRPEKRSTAWAGSARPCVDLYDFPARGTSWPRRPEKA